jgi:hypothetical protein
MADYAARWTVSQDAGFQQRVCIAIARVAYQYTNEQGSTPTVDTKRRALAATVYSDPEAHMARFAMVLASQDVLVDDPDETIETMVYQVWDGMAAILTTDYPEE